MKWTQIWFRNGHRQIYWMAPFTEPYKEQMVCKITDHYYSVVNGAKTSRTWNKELIQFWNRITMEDAILELHISYHEE